MVPRADDHDTSASADGDRRLRAAGSTAWCGRRTTAAAVDDGGRTGGGDGKSGGEGMGRCGKKMGRELL
jgi:hypothetical protein